SGQTILDTALSLGFSSSQYFATVFRRYMGMSPAEYGKTTDFSMNNTAAHPMTDQQHVAQ
ncbi:MAG: AraC family transcriptional regulator, partial [Planctomycetaceae bacterium]|nr:AraC family transcriptional regulator [Planctomycetaceae bacterium]